MQRENHLVVIGASSLAVNTARELARRGHAVTRVLCSAPESLQGQDSDVDLVVGDPSSNAVLREAGVQDAQAVLAMMVDEPENAFVILAAQEMGCKARTVAAVNDAANLSRAKRAPPDVVISPQVLGGELIAMMVSGETVTPDLVMGHVFQRSNDTASAA